MSTQLVDPKSATGRSKAAMLLVSIGSDRAADIFRHLRDDEVEALSLEIAKLDGIDQGAKARVLEEFAVSVQGPDAQVHAGVHYARDVLSRAFGAERAEEINGRLSSVIEHRPFEFMRRTPPEQIVTFLRNEAPQTI